MKLIERLKKDREIINKIDNKKDKYIYLWDYYKIPIVSIILIFFIIIATIFSTIGKKQEILYVVLLNNDSSIVEVDESIFIDELSKANIDTENKIVDVNSYLSLGLDDGQDGETLQVLNALFSLTDLDLFVGPKEYFDTFASKDAFCDLSLLIDGELLDKHKDDLYIYEDSNNQKIVGGIILHSDSIIHKAGYYHNDVIIGATSNGVNLENAIAFIIQILSD